MIFGPSDAEFHVELDGIKKCLHQKWPKHRDSNGRPEVSEIKGHPIQIKGAIFCPETSV